MSEEWLIRGAEVAPEEWVEEACGGVDPRLSPDSGDAPGTESSGGVYPRLSPDSGDAPGTESSGGVYPRLSPDSGEAPEAEEAPAPTESSGGVHPRLSPDSGEAPGEASAEAPAASEDSAEELDLAAPAPEAGPRCPYCRDPLRDVGEGHQDEGEAATRPVTCVECQTPVHARCAQIHGRCVTRGCRGRSFAFVDRVPRPEIRAARIVRPRAARPRGRAESERGPRVVPECPPDWWRLDAPLLVLGLTGILSLALFGDSLAAGAKRFDEVRASLLEGPAKVIRTQKK